MKKDLRRNSFIYDMENRDLLVYASIKLIKVFTVWSEYVRIILVRKIMGNSINHEQDHDSGIGGGGVISSEHQYKKCFLKRVLKS